jgi:2-methylaconitate cis-trans-isomerase PrpF
MQKRIPTVLMRGGTSKGLFFHDNRLPADPQVRSRVILAASEKEATQRSQAVPKIAFIAAPRPYTTLGGQTVTTQDIDLVTRIMSMGTLHRSLAVSGGISTAGAAMIPDTVAFDLLNAEARQNDVVRLGHPGGIIEVGAVIEKTNGTYHYREAVLGRTARRLMEGSVLVPEKYFKDD